MCPHTSFYIPLFHTDASQSTESVDESSPPLNSISTVITAITSGVAAFACILLLAAICFCVIMLRKRTLKKESKGLQHRTTVSKQEEQGPHYVLCSVHTMRKFQCRTIMSITL